MLNRRRPGRPYVVPIKSDGTVLVDEQGRGNYTLLANTTYYYPLGGTDAPIEGVQVQWDAAAVLTISIETSNLGDDEAANFSQTKGDWLREDPTTAYVAARSPDASVGGATITNQVAAVAGGTAGGCMFHLSFVGGRRSRVAIVVGGTGGVVRVAASAKD